MKPIAQTFKHIAETDYGNVVMGKTTTGVLTTINRFL